MFLLMLITGRDLHLGQKWGIKKKGGKKKDVSVKINEIIHVNIRFPPHLH